MSLTVCCLFVRGEYPYTVEYVQRLRAMVTRWIDRPFRFCCLTDQPELMPDGVEPIVIEKLPGFAPWTKLELFNPARKWQGRVLYLDLDSLIVAPLAPIIDYPTPFAITADPGRPGQKTRDSFGRQIVRRFNSSVMVWNGGMRTFLYDDWTPAVAERLSGDQDFLGERMPDAAAMPRAWFPRLSELTKDGSFSVPLEAKVVLVKVPKCVEASAKWSAFREAWA